MKEAAVLVDRIAEMKIESRDDCAAIPEDETTDAVKALFNLSKSPTSTSKWSVDSCDTGSDSGSGSLRVILPQNTKTNSGFYWQMKDIGSDQLEEISLKYEVKFEDGFDFKSDGKLPGIFGGEPSCSSGGADGCFDGEMTD